MISHGLSQQIYCNQRNEYYRYMSLVIRGEYPSSVFELMGKDENSATYALGWTLERCPLFLRLFISHIAGQPIKEAEGHLVLQKAGEDRGFTDLEIHYGRYVHCIVEAKQGWLLPTMTQLRRYKPRLDRDHRNAETKVMVTVSAASKEIAKLRLPQDIDGVPLMHISWGLIRALAQKALKRNRSLDERLWLKELIKHLEIYSAMDTLRDNMVYVVSLGSNAMRNDGTRTWIDVVEKDGFYFHPVGNHWPQQPPNYIAFRYRGNLQTVHRIESYEIWNNVALKNPLWCDTTDEHFVYKLGPAMRPPIDLKAGGTGDSLKRSARVWCAIDTLLAGQFEYLGQARDETRKRLIEADAAYD